jgi:Uma2 family endonuclease
MPAERRKGYTWEDYLSWPEGERWEIVGGEAVDMSPTPTSRHQIVAMALGRQIANFLEGRKCRALMAPMAVRLSASDVVEPDILVVCEPKQIKRTHIEGAPTLAVEILSDRTLRHDRVTKLELYERFGVREYWIVHPYPSLVEVYVLEGGRYRQHGGYEKHETLRSPTFPKLAIDLRRVFDFPFEPGEEKIRMVREGRPPYVARRRRRTRQG